jgi:hypothetical protein
MQSPITAQNRSGSGGAAMVIGLMPGAHASSMSSLQGSFAAGRPPVVLQSQDSSSASSLGSVISRSGSVMAAAMQLDRQFSGQTPTQMQAQQQQGQQQMLQIQQQQQQLLQVQQLETATSAAAQQLASLKLELQQRQQAQAANPQLLASMGSSGLPATSGFTAASGAVIMDAQGMMGQAMAGSSPSVQGAMAALQVPLQALPEPPGIVGESSSLSPGGGSSMGGCIAGGLVGEVLPAASAAAAAAAGGGGSNMVVLTAGVPAGQSYQIVHDAAGSCVVVMSEGLQQPLQQQQQQLMMMLSSVPGAAVLPGQVQVLGYGSQCMQ